jgi:hypothetical protein
MAALLEERAESAERTGRKLSDALDRFQNHKLVNLKAGAKLTVRNLAIEAKVSKDTPFSRYRNGQANAGEYRFPYIVDKNPRDNKIRELRQLLKAKDKLLLSQARAINQLDAELYDTKNRNQELEDQLAQLIRENMKVISISARRKKGK